MNHEDDVRRLLTDSRWDEDTDTDFLPLLSAALPARRFRRRLGRTLAATGAAVLVLGTGAAALAAHHPRPATLAATSQITASPNPRDCSLTPSETPPASTSSNGFAVALYDAGPGACALPHNVEVTATRSINSTAAVPTPARADVTVTVTRAIGSRTAVPVPAATRADVKVTVAPSIGLPTAVPVPAPARADVTAVEPPTGTSAGVTVAAHHEVAASVTTQCASTGPVALWTLLISDPRSGERIVSLTARAACAPHLVALTVR